MKKNRKFLVPVAALVGMLSTNHAFANIQNKPGPTEPNVSDATNAPAKNMIVVGDAKKQFKFTLRRTEQGTMVADHYSHESHASHASHSSHYSGS